MLDLFRYLANPSVMSVVMVAGVVGLLFWGVVALFAHKFRNQLIYAGIGAIVLYWIYSGLR